MNVSLMVVLLKRLVEFEDPALDAAEMERLATLPAVPQGTSLVDLVATDDALLLHRDPLVREREGQVAWVSQTGNMSGRLA